jgi:hypothetical protein
VALFERFQPGGVLSALSQTCVFLARQKSPLRATRWL